MVCSCDLDHHIIEFISYLSNGIPKIAYSTNGDTFQQAPTFCSEPPCSDGSDVSDHANLWTDFVDFNSNLGGWVNRKELTQEEMDFLELGINENHSTMNSLGLFNTTDI
jgi:hypothetical protein